MAPGQTDRVDLPAKTLGGFFKRRRRIKKPRIARGRASGAGERHLGRGSRSGDHSRGGEMICDGPCIRRELYDQNPHGWFVKIRRGELAGSGMIQTKI